MSVSLGEINRQASELYNSLSLEDRKNKAGLGYSLAQHTTICQIRQKNKEAWQAQDKKLAEWQNNIEQAIVKDFLQPNGRLL